MTIGKVIGTVVATQKSPKLKGMKLLVVGDLDLKGKRSKGYVVAVDTIGAGAGETVLVVRGSSARLPAACTDKPVDAAIIGIIDAIELD